MKYEDREKVINRFYSELDSSSARFLTRLKKLLTAGRIKDSDLARIVAEIDFYSDLGESGYFKAVDSYIREQESAIKEIILLAKKRGPNIGIMSLDLLDDVINIDAKVILRSGEIYSEQLKSAIVKNLIGGVSRKELVNELLPQMQETIPFRPNWLDTAINQSYTSMMNTTLKTAFEDEPNTKFILIHRIDARSRRLCIHAAELMKKYPEGLTIEQINGGKLNEGFKKRTPSENDRYTFENIGGFNCRGWWKVALED